MRTPYYIFIIGLDKLYFLPLENNETLPMRAMAIDRYIEANGWSWNDIIKEMEKPDPSIN